MKIRKNLIWFVIWSVLAAVLGILDAQGYSLYAMSSGVSVSRTLTIVCAILAGYQLGELTIKGSVKVRHGAPGEDYLPRERCHAWNYCSAQSILAAGVAEIASDEFREIDAKLAAINEEFGPPDCSED